MAQCNKKQLAAACRPSTCTALHCSVASPSIHLSIHPSCHMTDPLEIYAYVILNKNGSSYWFSIRAQLERRLPAGCCSESLLVGLLLLQWLMSELISRFVRSDGFLGSISSSGKKNSTSQKHCPYKLTQWFCDTVSRLTYQRCVSLFHQNVSATTLRNCMCTNVIYITLNWPWILSTVCININVAIKFINVSILKF